jgi:hypothetical protein
MSTKQSAIEARVQIAGNELFPYRDFPEDVTSISAVIDPERPWLATVTEILDTKAPPDARPYCCYLQTVIFYVRPWQVVDGNYAEHDRLETKLNGHDFLRIGGEVFELYGGEVSHDGKRWIMTHGARRRTLLSRAKEQQG